MGERGPSERATEKTQKVKRLLDLWSCPALRSRGEGKERRGKGTEERNEKDESWEKGGRAIEIEESSKKESRRGKQKEGGEREMEDGHTSLYSITLLNRVLRW